LANKRIGPLDGFRSKAGWPFSAEIALKFNEEEQNWKLEFDFGEDKNALESGELVDFGEQVPLGACPSCGARVFERGQNYVCEHSLPNVLQATPTCTFKSGKIVLQQPVEHEQIKKLLETGKTDLLDKFVSMRTRRAFKAYLAWDATAGKVQFEFEPRVSKYPPRKTPSKTTGKVAGKVAGKTAAKSGKATATATTTASAKAVKASKPKTPRKPSAGLVPSTALAQVIGSDAAPRTEVIKKLWDYIKSKGLQDPKDKRKIVCDASLQAVFGKDEVNMFELAGLIGAHLSAA
jgi:DNA topoisomerase-3